jgi:Holliday junction DNA helicase RuvB
MPHVLLTGPAGHGKTTLAYIIAKDLDVAFIETTGMMLRKPDDLVRVLSKISQPSVLFVDEIHALRKPVMEVLYQVLEGGRVSFVSGGTALTLDLPPLTCVAATTSPGALTEPLRQRFGYVGNVASYSYEELATIVANQWKRQGIKHGKNEPMEVATRCKGVPRRAVRLAERVLDYSAVHGHTGVPVGLVAEALASFNIDEDGLEPDDWRIIRALTTAFAGRPVGIDSLASYLDMDTVTIAEQHEPFLCQCEIMARTKSGRIAMPLAYQLMERS